MAIGAFAEAAPADGGEGYSGRVTPFVLLSCVVAGSGGILFGYDLGISGQSCLLAPHYFCCNINPFLISLVNGIGERFIMSSILCADSN